jgi:hypothetical protein
LIGELARPVADASEAFENVAVIAPPQASEEDGVDFGRAGPIVTDAFAVDAPSSKTSGSAQPTNPWRTERTPQS